MPNTINTIRNTIDTIRPLLSQLDKHRSTKWVVAASNPSRTKTQGLKITEENGCLCSDI